MPRAGSCLRTFRAIRWYRKVNPADAPILILSLTSDTLPAAADLRLAPIRSWRKNLRRWTASGKSTSAAAPTRRCACELNPNLLNKFGVGLEEVRTALAAANANGPKASLPMREQLGRSTRNDQMFSVPSSTGRSWSPTQNGASGASRRCGGREDAVEDVRNAGWSNGKPAVAGDYLPPARRQHHRDRGPRARSLPQLERRFRQAIELTVVARSNHRRCARRCATWR